MNLEEILEKCLCEYRNYKGVANCTAITKLGEIYNLAAKNNISNKIKYKWIKIIKNELETLNSDTIINDCINNLHTRVNHITSIGEVFNDDEFLLILTLRTELELTYDLCIGLELNCVSISFLGIDDDINEISKFKENISSFNKAKSLISKNWGLPLQVKYFPSR